MSFKIVERNVRLYARNHIEKDVKNKWVWNWLLEKDVNGDFLSDCVRKIWPPGVAIPFWCKETLHYGSSGKKRIKFNALQNKEKHLKNRCF